MSEQFDGKVDIVALGNTSNVRITLDGYKAYIISGDKGQDSDLFLSKWFRKKRISISLVNQIFLNHGVDVI